MLGCQAGNITLEAISLNEQTPFDCRTPINDRADRKANEFARIGTTLQIQEDCLRTSFILGTIHKAYQIKDEQNWIHVW